MPKINNSAVIQKMMDELKLYPGTDVIPTELAEKILPVFQINSDKLSVTTEPSNIVRSSNITSSATLFTIPANEDFYLCNLLLRSTDVLVWSGGHSVVEVSVTVDGVAQNVSIARFVNSEPPHALDVSYSHPIKCDRGTTVDIVLGAIATTSTFYATVIGYTSA